MPFHYLSHHLKSIQPLQFFSHFKTLQQQPSEQKIWIHLSTFQLQHTKSNLECVCTHALYAEALYLGNTAILFTINRGEEVPVLD